MLYLASSAVRSVWRFIAGLPRITEVSHPLFGGVAHVGYGPDAFDADTDPEDALQNAVIKAINLTLVTGTVCLLHCGRMWRYSFCRKIKLHQRAMTPNWKNLKVVDSKKDYNCIADEIYQLWRLKQNALEESSKREGMGQKIKERREFLYSYPMEIIGYDELLERRWIEKVTIYNE